VTDADSDDLPPEPTARAQFARAPLVPVAVAVTVGVLTDRFLGLSAGQMAIVFALGLAAWFCFRERNGPVAKFGLLVCWAGLAGSYHHYSRNFADTDDIGRLVTDPPGLVRFRGVLVEEPVVVRLSREDPFVPTWKADRGTALVACRSVLLADGWRPASGRIKLTVDRGIDPSQPSALDDLRIGDEIETTGFLHTPRGPANPGETDFADLARDRRVSAEVRVSKSTDAVVRIERSSGMSLNGTLAAVRRHATGVIDAALPPAEAGLARALLLGDGAAMERAEWDEYVRTGVVHVLAISGQHLVILAAFVWTACRVLGIPRRTTTYLVMGLVIAYAAVTGLRPSAVRAAVMVAVMCLSLVRRRPLNTANAIAFAWLIVVALDPVDLVNVGNLLSFLSVFTLIWGASVWLTPKPKTAGQKLFDEFRPAWQKSLLTLGRIVLAFYAANAILFVANAPLIAAYQNIVSPVGLLVGPPLILLTAVALVMGFLMLLAGSLHPWLAIPFGWITKWSLTLCGMTVTFADRMPGGAVYVPDPPAWWLVGFYFLGVLLVFSNTRMWRIRLATALFACLLVPLALPFVSPKPDELRVTFLAVGHGGCTVLECPDGRVLVYDVGTLAGPDAVRRSVAPFLWHRGIRRVDELFLSHADADHFNGVPEMLRRFPVGRITMTPSFAEKPTPEVAATLAAIKRANVEVRVAVAGDRFEAGGVRLDVLHPPPEGPQGIENERSLVLHVTHDGHTLLLAGDLEKQGTSRVLSLPFPGAEVVMAPHHGSRAAFPASFRNWAKPSFVVVSRGDRGSPVTQNEVGPNVTLWDTATVGAVTVRSDRSGLTAGAFRTGDRVVIGRGSKTPRQ
jgi:competence protein ComEC